MVVGMCPPFTELTPKALRTGSDARMGACALTVYCESCSWGATYEGDGSPCSAVLLLMVNSCGGA